MIGLDGWDEGKRGILSWRVCDAYVVACRDVVLIADILAEGMLKSVQ